MKGSSLLVTLFLLVAITFIVASVGILAKFGLTQAYSTKSSTIGFFSAESGLNLRAASIKVIFQGYNVPTGQPPSEPDACLGTNRGSGDFACQENVINGRTVITYVVPATNNPRIITIPRGELYQGLTAQEYVYTIKSVALNPVSQAKEAQLELILRSRLVPLFQFAAFYNKDLEILPGPEMFLAGPVHSNGDLYLDSGNSLTIKGQVTTAGRLFRGRKNQDICQQVNRVKIFDPITQRALIPYCSSRVEVVQNDVLAWNNMINIGVDRLQIPPPDIIASNAASVYWSRADLRLALNLNSSPGQFQIENVAGEKDPTLTTAFLNNSVCRDSVRIKDFNNRRERQIADTTLPSSGSSAPGTTITLLDIDFQSLLNCLHNTSWLGTSKRLDDTSDGGLVFFFTVRGPRANPPDLNNNGLPDYIAPYGIRIRNAASLRSTNSSAPVPKGITVVSDQAIYLWGDFNSQNWIPAAVMTDSLNILSNSWSNNRNGVDMDDLSLSSCNLSERQVTTDTTINAAFLSGTDSTGLREGTSGQNLGIYNGGLENYPRFHENWSGRWLNYRGSFVSLNRPMKVRGFWEHQCYSPPSRNWQYDVRFNDAANLPPLTPRFVYLKQELFVRRF